MPFQLQFLIAPHFLIPQIDIIEKNNKQTQQIDCRQASRQKEKKAI